MVVVDATILMLFLRPDTPVPARRGIIVERPKDRIDYLVIRLSKAKTRIIIPAPALSEVLVRVSAAEAASLVERLSRYAVFRIEPFDTLAAIQVASMTRNTIDSPKRPKRREGYTWAKLKYDRQIVAIASVAGADTIYTDDHDIAAIAKREGIRTIGLCDLALPESSAQEEMDLQPMRNDRSLPPPPIDPDEDDM